MLDCLRIRNLALIDDMELEFVPGMNVLTGETGAGKSFILKALGFVLGNRLAADMVRPGAKKARVEAIFSLEDGEEILISRELLADSGRSRIQINDHLCTREAVLNLRDRLVVHTSQHEQQYLLQPAWQARLIDSLLPDSNKLQERDAIAQELRTLAEKLQNLRQRWQSLSENRDLLEMRQEEIDKVAPKKGEEEFLEAQRTKARENSKLQQHYERALSFLSGNSEEVGLLGALSKFESLLQPLCALDADFGEEIDALANMRSRLHNLEITLRHPPNSAEILDMDALEARLYELSRLKRKLRRTIPEILNLKAEITENLSFLDACNLDIAAIEKNMLSLSEKLQKIIQEIKPERQKAAQNFVQLVEAELRELGFDQSVKIVPEFQPYTIWQDISDEKARLLWAPNPGQPAHPLDRIVSGGELSRLLLSLIVTQPHAESAICIFDEVDAGVGGLTLNKLADKLAKLSETRQILLITHWPQLAMRGQKHFRVEKVVHDGQTCTLCAALDAKEKQKELARMYGEEPDKDEEAEKIEHKIDKEAKETRENKKSKKK